MPIIETIATGIHALELAERIEKLVKGRARQAALLEIADGAPISLASDDDETEIYARIAAAATAGATVMNLRLMLRILKGLGGLGRPVYASDFARFQRAVADLSREEVILLTVLYRNFQAKRADPKVVVPIGPAWEATVAELVPDVFPDETHMRGTAYGAQRSGLLLSENSMDAMGYLTPSPMMEELVALAVLDETLGRSATTPKG